MKQKISVVLDPESFSWSPEELLENVLDNFSIHCGSTEKAVEEMEHGKACEFGPFRFSKAENGYLVEAICKSENDACDLVFRLLNEVVSDYEFVDDRDPDADTECEDEDFLFSSVAKQLRETGEYVDPWGTEFRMEDFEEVPAPATA